jgi:hypothetical protein
MSFYNVTRRAHNVVKLTNKLSQFHAQLEITVMWRFENFVFIFIFMEFKIPYKIPYWKVGHFSLKSPAAG